MIRILKIPSPVAQKMEIEQCALVFYRLMCKSVGITALYVNGVDGQGVKIGDTPEPTREAIHVGNKLPVTPG